MNFQRSDGSLSEAPLSPAHAGTSYRPLFKRLIEKFFGLWFLLSLSAVTLCEGWAFARFGVRWSTVLPAFILLLWIPVIAGKWKALQRKSWKLLLIPGTSAFLAATFLGGVFVAETNFLRINDWANGSMESLRSALIPVQYFSPPQRVVVPVEEQKKKAHALMGLRLFPNNSQGKLLVSFNHGLAILKDRRIRFLTQERVQLSLLSMLLPDQSFLYSPENSGTGLTRAVIRGGALYKLWEMSSPNLYLHHWGDEFEGSVYHPGKDFVSLPNDISEEIGYAFAECMHKESMHDTVRVFDVDTGRLVTSIDLLPIIASLKETDEFLAKSIWDCADPLHLNDVQIIKSEKYAQFFPDGKVGDILVSMRRISTIMLIDKDTLQAKWYAANQFRLQHSPRITDRGTILVFDNWGSDQANGKSRITEISIASKKRVGFWEARGDDFFNSNVRGKITLLDDKILVQEQDSKARGNASLFYLDCPEFPISNACTRKNIFMGKPPNITYDNAVLLEAS